MNINWNANQYTASFGFVAEYGKGMMELIDAPKGSTVIDLGCGNGTLTRQLADRGYRVEGIDQSAELLALARQTYPHLTFTEGDATRFEVNQPVDVVFSNAVFHWIDAERHSALMQCICQALKPGGQLVCEFGGHGNNALIHCALTSAFARRNRPYANPFYFPTIGEYAPIIEAAGLRITFATLFDRTTELKGVDGLADWIRMFVKVPFGGIADEEKEDIIHEVVDELRPTLFHDGKWYADYVRIRFKAVKIQSNIV